MPPPNNKSMMMNTRPGRIGGDSDESETPLNNPWVGNLASDVADSDLMDLFAQYGVLDSITSYSSHSYAFVFFKRIKVAKAAKDTLQGADLHGRPIKIEFARPEAYTHMQFPEVAEVLSDCHFQWTSMFGEILNNVCQFEWVPWISCSVYSLVVIDPLITMVPYVIMILSHALQLPHSYCGA